MDKPRQLRYNSGKDTGKGGMRMASIRCKTCGKAYDYDKEGFCPDCGAYNRPPRQERTDAEGGIRYAGQEKVCGEEKARFEEQIHRSEPKKNAASGVVGAVIAAAIAIVILSVLRGFVGHTGFDLPRREPEPGHSGEAEAPVEESKPVVWERAEVGARFTLGENADEATSVDDVWIDDDEKLHAVVTLEETYQAFPSLFGTDGSGGEYQHWLESIQDTEKGEYTFECIYDLSYRPHDNMQLVFYGIDKEVWVSVQL